MQPCPFHPVQPVTIKDANLITIRPMPPEDAGMELPFVPAHAGELRCFRFIGSIRELSPPTLSRFTQVDYIRHMALIAVIEPDGRELPAGAARQVIDDGGQDCGSR